MMYKGIMIVIIMCILLTGCSETEKTISISTGTPGGSYYPIGSTIAQILDETLPNVAVNSLSGNASIANCELIGEGLVEMALVQNNVAYWAYKGLANFEGNPVTQLRGVASLYPEAIQVVVPKASAIRSIHDLKGKKVGIGLEGSGVFVDAINILQAYDIDITDIEAQYISFKESMDALALKKIDAVFITAGFPTTSINSLSIQEPLRILSLEEDRIEEIVSVSPYYDRIVIPAGTYTAINEEVITITTMAMLVITEALDEELVYQLTKALWENKAPLRDVHENGKYIAIENALIGMGIPLHEGAERYYEEVLD